MTYPHHGPCIVHDFLRAKIDNEARKKREKTRARELNQNSLMMKSEKWIRPQICALWDKTRSFWDIEIHFPSTYVSIRVGSRPQWICVCTVGLKRFEKDAFISWTTSRTEFGQQMRSGGLPAFYCLFKGIVSCSWCYFGPFNRNTTRVWPMDGPTDRHTLL